MILFFNYKKHYLLGPETRTLDAVAVGWTTFATLLIIGSLGEDIILPAAVINILHLNYSENLIYN